MNKLRWGILGAATIAQKNWKAILNSGNGVLTAVASRDLEKARQFVRTCQGHAPYQVEPRALGSYDELIASPDVDALYIPLPTRPRKQWVIRAAEAGKHVLCEKPCAVSVADLREMLEACRRHRVQFMDGVMFAHCNRLTHLRNALKDPEAFGDVRRIVANFSFRGPPEFFQTNIRANSNLEPLGCLGDLGWYCVRFALWVMNWQKPLEAAGRILRQSASDPAVAAVPTEFSGELTFADGVSAGFHCSFYANEQWAIVTGTNAYVQLADFVLPFTNQEMDFEVRRNVFTPVGCDFKMESNLRRIPIGERGDDATAAQEVNMFRNFASQVQSGELNPEWPEQTLRTQEVVNACLDSARS